MTFTYIDLNSSQNENSVIVIPDDDDNKDESRSKKTGLDSGDSLSNNVHNPTVTKETETNTITLLSKSMEHILNFFQWRNNDYVRAATTNSNEQQSPNTTSRFCIKPSSLRSTRRFAPYEKTIRHDLIGAVSADEMLLILADVPPYNNSIKKFKLDKKVFSEVNRYLNYNPPTLKQMCLILLNLYHTSVDKKILTLEQETFVFLLLNRILNFLESLMLISGEGSIVPFKPPSDFRNSNNKKVPERLPDHFYGDLKTLSLYAGNNDMSRYELFKIIRHFDQVAVTSTREKAEKYLLKSGVQPRIPLRRTYEDALVEAKKREEERKRYKATSCKLDAEKEFAAARERQAKVDKKEIPKEPSTAVNEKTTKRMKRSSPAKDERSSSDRNDRVPIERRKDTVSSSSSSSSSSSRNRSTQDIISQTQPTSRYRSGSPTRSDTYNDRLPRTTRWSRRSEIRPDQVPKLGHGQTNPAIFGSSHPYVVDRNLRLSGSIPMDNEPILRRSSAPDIRNENEPSSRRSNSPVIRNKNEPSSKISRRPLLQTEEERERNERSRRRGGHRYY